MEPLSLRLFFDKASVHYGPFIQYHTKPSLLYIIWSIHWFTPVKDITFLDVWWSGGKV